MPRRTAPTPATTQASPGDAALAAPVPRPVAVGMLGLAAMLIGAWLATQGGLFPTNPAAVTRLAGALAQAALPLAWIAGAAAGYGWGLARLSKRWLRARPATAMGLGLLAWLWLTWVAGLTAGAGSAVALGVDLAGWALLCFGIVGIARTANNRSGYLQKLRRSSGHVSPAWAALGLPLGVLLAAACCPPGALWRVEAYGYDALSYHLQLPRKWIELNRVGPLPHNLYSALPSLVEAGYTRLGVIAGGYPRAAIPAQLLHAGLYVCAALVLADAARSRFGKPMAPWAAALLLAVPWAVVTGSLPYTEGAAVLALTLLLSLHARRVRSSKFRSALRLRAVATGAVVAIATLAKPSALLVVGGPAVLLGLASLGWWPGRVKHPRTPIRSGLTACTLGLGACLLVAAPWWGPNLARTGNPVFPLMTQTLGAGPLTPEQATRWDAAHGASAARGESRLGALWNRWLASPGYGAVPLSSDSRESATANSTTANPQGFDITRFHGTPGLPLLLIAGVIGALRSARASRGRRVFLVLIVAMLVLQAALWLGLTHRQGRFMAASIPLLALAACGLARATPRRRRVAPAALAGVVLVICGVSIEAMQRQTRPLQDDQGQPARLPAGAFVGQAIDQHPLNNLAVNRVMVLGGYGSLLYIDPPALYASPFNTHPLADMLGPAQTPPQDPALALRDLGVSHVWVDYAELERFRQTLGLDPRLAPERVAQAMRTWPVAYRGTAQVAYRVP